MGRTVHLCTETRGLRRDTVWQSQNFSLQNCEKKKKNPAVKATSLIFCCDSPSNIVVPFPGEARSSIGPCFQCELMWWEKDLSLAPAHRKPGWDCGNKPCLRVALYRDRTQSPISGRAGALWPCAMTFLLQVVEWHRASAGRQGECLCVSVSLPLWAYRKSVLGTLLSWPSSFLHCF